MYQRVNGIKVSDENKQKMLYALTAVAIAGSVFFAYKKMK